MGTQNLRDSSVHLRARKNSHHLSFIAQGTGRSRRWRRWLDGIAPDKRVSFAIELAITIGHVGTSGSWSAEQLRKWWNRLIKLQSGIRVARISVEMLGRQRDHPIGLHPC